MSLVIAPVVTRTPFRQMAERWCEEYYRELGRAEVDRERTVRGHIARIDTFMTEQKLTLETMVRDKVKALQASLTRAPQPVPTGPSLPEGMDPEQLLTLNEARDLPGMASKATLKRRIADGLLVPAERGSGAYRYRLADLYADPVLRGSEGGLRRGPRRTSLSQDVANDVMWVFNQVCLFAADHGVTVPQDRASLAMHRTDRPDGPRRQPVALVTCAQIAQRLHAVHQLALWLMRVLGLRIGEAYGIQVADVIDQGPCEPGIVTIKAQGGRRYARRGADGSPVFSDRVEEPKNEGSRRVLVVPPALMGLIRIVIEIFHTDTEGNVRLEARLIPGLKRRDSGGQGTFRRALALAAAAEGVVCSDEEEVLEAVFSLTPHNMRRSVLSDLNRLGAKHSHSQRFAGHVPGTSVLARHYLLDDPKLRPLIKIARLIEGEISAELPQGLQLPTPVRCTTGVQEHLHEQADRLDGLLAERGWLVLPADATDGEPLLGAEEVAAELGITVQTARRWMVEGVLPALVFQERARGAQRCARLDDVTRLREELASRLTLKAIAEEVGQPYHTVYQYVRAQQLELESSGGPEKVVPADTARRLREHYAAQAALHARAVPLSVAAGLLNTSVAVVSRLLDDGTLIEDDRAHDQRRMVTRCSVEAHREKRDATAAPAKEPVREDLLSWAEACALAGLAAAELDALVAAGRVDKVMHRRRRHVTASSLLGYLAVEAPVRLLVHCLATGQGSSARA